MIPNIFFKIGQPSTGKSYFFKEDNLKKILGDNLEYKKIPVSGGVGNEYKGLQNTDLAISYDVVNRNIKFGEFLQFLMKAIVNPNDNYVVFLDDFHNQDISSLLSEYTPLFKSQQKVSLKDKITEVDIVNMEEFESVDKFIKEWNKFIRSLGVHYESVTNRVSGDDLLLVFPDNFYLFGAANFNEKTISIFADWADRAVIEYIDPIEVMEKIKEENEFINCAKKLNYNLKEVLENNFIFDYEKYCFGIWKIVDEKGEIISDEAKQKEIIKFFFFMIKNSLIYNNKNSEINKIGWELIKKMKDDEFFQKFNIEINSDWDLENNTKEIFKILHYFGIYEN